MAADELRCPQEELIFRRADGIWRFLLPERESHYVRFIADYQAVRRFEGRGSAEASYYRALPFTDLSGRFSADWKIRAASYRALEKLVSSLPPARILDMGAGNCWLSNRLAARGHELFAVDLLVNTEDGLGAWLNYENRFTPVQAEFARLPIPDSTVSLVIFNASFHYSENYEETLTESLRVLLPGGRLVIMDSPVYYSRESGEQMVAERKAQFEARYGFASDSLQSENYLTHRRMNALGEKFGVRWKHIRPFYGLRWAIRPWLARLRGKREPAELGLWFGDAPKPR
jgi:SAM-dependent methyltransferase